MSKVTNIVDKLGQCQYFSILHLASSIRQIQMNPNSITKTALNVENAAATFSRVVVTVLRDLQGNVIVCCANLEEHIKNVRQIFENII